MKIAKIIMTVILIPAIWVLYVAAANVGIFSDIVVKGPWLDARAYSTLNAAVADAFGKEVHVYRPITMTASFSTGTNVKLVIHHGGQIISNGTYTAAINGPFEAGLSQVFAGFPSTGISFGPGSVKDVYAEWWGARADGSTDCYAALVSANSTGSHLMFSGGTYNISQPVSVTSRLHWTGVKGFTRIKLTAGANAYIMQMDGTGPYIYNAKMENIVFDGNGHATDGLFLKNGVIASTFSDLRITNVSGAGLHLNWAQSCEFRNFTVSNNVELFTTQPANGILNDGGGASSDNTFINPIIEHVSGSGIKLLSAINNVFIDGTTEGNNVGLELGEAIPSQGLLARYNVFIGIDMEVNAVSDVILRNTGGNNTFISPMFYSGTSMQFFGSSQNSVTNGIVGGVSIDASSAYNKFQNVTLYGSGKTITDSGGRMNFNTIIGCFNTSDGGPISDKPFRRIIAYTVSSGTVTIDVSKAAYAEVSVGANPITIGAPSNPVDGDKLDITIFSDATHTANITWASGVGAFRSATGWTNPGPNKNRSSSWRYYGDINYWYPVSFSQTDENN